MKKFLRSFWAAIVGGPYGFTGEGNEQWYYFLSLAINLMLVWWLAPEVVLIFTIASIIHYATIFVYGYFDFECSDNKKFAWVWGAIHLAIFLIALYVSVKWTLITSAITICAYLIAPDCTGNNIFIKDFNSASANEYILLIFNTIIFSIFVCIAWILPINLWCKLAIIVAAMVIHPVIDLYAGECVIISDVVSSIWSDIKGGYFIWSGVTEDGIKWKRVGIVKSFCGMIYVKVKSEDGKFNILVGNTIMSKEWVDEVLEGEENVFGYPKVKKDGKCYYMVLGRDLVPYNEEASAE